MKTYLDSLSHIYNHGHDHEDRTGVGRRSVFGTQERYDLREGFPLVTTRKIYTKSLIAELLWFIKSETNINTLEAKFWDKWALKQSDIDSYLQESIQSEAFKEHCSGMSEDEQQKLIDATITNVSAHLSKHIGSIGPLYGAMWRNAPISRHTRNKDQTPAPLPLYYPSRTVDQIPSDKLEIYKAMFTQYMTLAHKDNIDENTFDSSEFLMYINNKYWDSYDQLNEVILSLKEKPFSSRHCVTAWIPQYLPDESISPDRNILNGKGALAPCHAFFQFFATPNKNGKHQLSLQLYIRSNDCPIGKPYNIAQYALLLAMVAQVVDMEPKELVYTSGDSHIYLNQLEQIQTQLDREPYPLPKLKLNPEIKDLFKFTMADIEIVDYQCHEPIVYPTSV